MKNFSLLMALLLGCLWHQAAAQNRTVSGRVTERASGQGLPGVTVIVKGQPTIGTSTNAEGAYTLSVPPTATTLVFSFIGYTAAEQAVGNGTNINAALATDAKQLGEVVVTGALGIQRQSQEVGYATATLDTKEILQSRPTNVVNGLTAKVSGLQVQTLSAGVNPTVRVTLRGSRSLTGNNEALIVIDGVISPNEALVALNPSDIADITVLKGANAAALYGFQASNGALIITTKKGGTASQITLSQTSQFESISFLPKFQDQFGPGARVYTSPLAPFTADNSPDSGYDTQYQGFENQQYGPRFDGSLRSFGEKLANGDVQTITYNARPDEKRKFFNAGYQAQTGVTFSGGDEKTKFYTSYQNTHNNGIVPKDKYDRNTFRFNASRELGRLTAGFNVSYSQQRVDQTTNADRDNSVYWNLFNTSVLYPITAYKDWQNNEFANPNGYANAFYFNPYFIIDNNRNRIRTNTLLGNIDLSYRIKDWLRVQARVGTTNTDQNNQSTQNQFTYNAYVRGNNTNKGGGGVPGYVRDLTSTYSRINSDIFISLDKSFGNFSVKGILGNNVQQITSRYSYVASTALAVPDLFTLSNSLGRLTGSDANYQVRLYAFYADVTLGYKDLLFVHGSGRNDHSSLLLAGNNSFFYPGVDASLVFSNAIPALKDASFLDYGKIRGGITKVALINLPNTISGVAQSSGAYALNSTYSPGSGFPFGSLAGYSADNGSVVPSLKPESTVSTEAGIELSFLKHRVAGAATYYAQKSTNQTISSGISSATGYTSVLLNAGEVRNHGIEVDINFTPVRTENGLTVTFGGNYNYNNNEVISLPVGIPQLLLNSNGSANAQLVAIPKADGQKAQPFPLLQGSYYQRTDDGRVKMTQITDPNGNTRYFPLKAADTKVFGNTQPKYKYGFNAAVSYKGLTLSGQGEVRAGYVIYNAIGETLDFSGGGQRSVTYGRQDFLYPNSAISNDGGKTYVANTAGLTPGGSEFWASGAYNTSVAENYVTTGKFFKIRELSLSYALPTNVLSSIGFVKGLSLNIFGRNLYTWVPKQNIYTDPEFSYVAPGSPGVNGGNSNGIGINTYFQTPPTKFYGASLNATF